MFDKLKNRIIIITMAITTVVLVIAGTLIMLFSSTMRPEPNNLPEPDFSMPNPASFDSQELENYIKTDREEGNNRLLVTLLSAGAMIEIIVFIVSYYMSEKIVVPVKESYEKQKMFIANASHELKTPLAIIEANVEALEVDKKNEKWKGNIETEVAHANKLVLDLLQLAKMDAGEINKNDSERVDIDALIRERVELFQPKFSGKISYDLKKVNEEYVLAKQDFLQVFDILLDNATKYGKKRVEVILDQNTISIANDGTTIEKEDLEKVFDRFYQTDKTKEGSGLGLAIAKAVCEQNKWQISCKSNKKLTTFVVEI